MKALRCKLHFAPYFAPELAVRYGAQNLESRKDSNYPHFFFFGHRTLRQYWACSAKPYGILGFERQTFHILDPPFWMVEGSTIQRSWASMVVPYSRVNFGENGFCKGPLPRSNTNTYRLHKFSTLNSSGRTPTLKVLTLT